MAVDALPPPLPLQMHDHVQLCLQALFVGRCTSQMHQLARFQVLSLTLMNVQFPWWLACKLLVICLNSITLFGFCVLTVAKKTLMGCELAKLK